MKTPQLFRKLSLGFALAGAALPMAARAEATPSAGKSPVFIEVNLEFDGVPHRFQIHTTEGQPASLETDYPNKESYKIEVTPRILDASEAPSADGTKIALKLKVNARKPTGIGRESSTNFVETQIIVKDGLESKFGGGNSTRTTLNKNGSSQVAQGSFQALVKASLQELPKED